LYLYPTAYLAGIWTADNDTALIIPLLWFPIAIFPMIITYPIAILPEILHEILPV
jgi:hypothetical protein